MKRVGECVERKTTKSLAELRASRQEWKEVWPKPRSALLDGKGRRRSLSVGSGRKKIYRSEVSKSTRSEASAEKHAKKTK